MIHVVGAVRRYGEIAALDGVDLHVAPGEVVAIMGPSGSGKSTLLRCLVGLDSLTEGEIEVGGRRLTGPSGEGRRVQLSPAELRALRHEVGIVFQRFNLFPHMTALANVMTAPRWALGRPLPEARELALELLRKVRLEDRAEHRPDQLSGGEQQRVAIARALASRPRALLCDEITSALDPETVGDVLETLRELADDGMTMVVVTHEVHFARAVAQRAVIMDRGRVIEQGPAGLVLGQPRQERTRAFLSRVLDRERENARRPAAG